MSRSASAIVVVGLAGWGVLLGALWSVLAPAIHTITALTRSGERVDAFLGKEADNLFVAAAMMIGLLTMTAVVSAVLVWQWRAHRGPVQIAALCAGQVAAAAAATAVGALLAHLRYGTPDRAAVRLSPENKVHYFTEAPPVFLGHSPIQMSLTLLVPAAMAALVYALMAIGTPHDDLGGRPPHGHPGLPPGAAPRV